MNRKIRVGLIYGGKSGEHDVSLQTALSVMQAFDLNKYEVKPIYITHTGEWRSGAYLNAPVQNKDQLALPAGKQGNAMQEALSPLFASGEGKQVRIASTTGEDPVPPVDVVFPLLHGTFGEDGTIQGLLEMANIPYVGCGVLASAAGMDKVVMKKLFAQEDLPQCVYRYFTRSAWDKERDYHLMEIETALGYPCFVKPANLGSSVGISKAADREGLIRAVEEAFRYDRKVIVEEFIDAREVEMSVLGNEEIRVSVPGEVVSSNDFYDYRAKYVDGTSQMIIPADIPEEAAAQARELAVRAFQALDASGLARVDFFLTRAEGKILINEINTMPGFTPYSMYPLLWKESGLEYRELVNELIRLAIERHAQKQSISYDFEVQ